MPPRAVHASSSGPSGNIIYYLGGLNEHATAGDTDATEAEFKRLNATLLQRFPLNRQRVAYNTVIKAFSNSGDYSGAARWYNLLLERGIEPNSKTYGKLIEACVRGKADPSLAANWMRTSQRRGFEVDEVYLHMFMRAALKSQKFDSIVTAAVEVEKGGLMPGRILEVIVAFDMWLPGTMPAAERQELLQRFVKNAALRHKDRQQELPGEARRPDVLTFGLIIAATAQAGDDEKVKVLLQRAEKHGIEILPSLHSVLRRLALRRGDIESFEHWAHEAGDDPDVIEGRLQAAANSGDLELAEDIFERHFLKEGHRPTATSYTSMIFAAVSAGDLRAAESWMERCLRDDLVPPSEAFNALIDQASRLGEGEKAQHWMEAAFSMSGRTDRIDKKYRPRQRSQRKRSVSGTSHGIRDRTGMPSGRIH